MDPDYSLNSWPPSIDSDKLCENDDNLAVFMFVRPNEYCDQVFCEECAIEHLIETNSDQPGFDEASADAAIESMILEGSVVRL